MAFILSLVLYYLLSGLIIAFGLELMIRKCDADVNFMERWALIWFWPIMLGICVVYFLIGLFEKD